MSKHPLAIIFALLNAICFSQPGIRGRIMDEKQQALPFCALGLLNAKDSLLVKGNITDESGKYYFSDIAAGKYIIKASAPGYKNAFTAPFAYDSAAQVQIEDLHMISESVSLNEVAITVLKKPIEFKNGNIVVNVDGSPLAAGNTVYDLLMRMPGVLVDGDNISIQGRGAARFLIDNRLQQLAGPQMTTLLKSMNATSVEKIEIINNPSAKYDAAGGGGLIHIHTKKVKITGFSGNLMTNYSQGFYTNSFGQLSLNYKGKKFGVFTNYNANYADYRAKNHWHRDVTYNGLVTALDQYYMEYSHNRFASFYGGADWYINKKNTLSLRADLRPGKETIVRHATTDVSDNSLGYNKLLFDFEKPNNWFWQDYNLNYELMPDTQGTKLTFNASWSSYPETYGASYSNHYLDTIGNDVMPLKIFQSTNQVNLDLLIGKLDFEKSFGKWKTESGLKASKQNMESDFLFQNLDNSSGQYTIDTSLTNAFTYREQILAGYLETSREWKKFSFRAGLRGENTSIQAANKTNSVKYTRNYFNLFPTAALDYNITASHNLQISYNRRINRPDYNNFNPYKAFRSILTYVQGNPYLFPQYTDRVELRHTYKGKISNAISYSAIKNYFFSYNIQSPQTKELIFYNGNLKNAGIFSYTGFLQTDITRWWMISLNLGVHYFYCSGPIQGVQYQTAALNTNAWTLNQFSLSSKTKLEITFWGNGPWKDGVNQTNPRGSLNFGIKQKLLKDKLDLSLGMMDVLYTLPVQSSIKYADQNSYSLHQWDSRRVYFNLNYNFGRIHVQQKNLKDSREEKDRARRS
jgi:hypothetical protein